MTARKTLEWAPCDFKERAYALLFGSPDVNNDHFSRPAPLKRSELGTEPSQSSASPHSLYHQMWMLILKGGAFAEEGNHASVCKAGSECTRFLERNNKRRFTLTFSLFRRQLQQCKQARQGPAACSLLSKNQCPSWNLQGLFQFV